MSRPAAKRPHSIAWPADLANEIYGRHARRIGGRLVLNRPVTFLSADRITNATAEAEGDEATGTVSFKAPELYEGTAQYTALREDGAWRITEWRMPAHDIHLIYDDEARRWTRAEDPPAQNSKKGSGANGKQG